jgi:hypothetical protein
VFDVPLHPQNPRKIETYKICVKTFKSGTPEEWCHLREQVETLAMCKGHKVSDQYQDDDIGNTMSDVLIPLYTAVLEGHASCKVEEHMTLSAKKTIALNEIAKILQPSEFGHRLETLNGYLEYFPRQESAEGNLLQNRPLSEDELLEIVDEAWPSGIQKLMIASKDSVTKYDSFDCYISILDGWYEVNGLQIALAKKNEKEGESNQKKRHPNDNSGKGYKSGKKRAVEANKRDQKQKCGHCGGTHPWPEDKCRHKKDINEKSKRNGGQKDYKEYERHVKELASCLLTKVLEAKRCHLKPVSTASYICPECRAIPDSRCRLQ